MKTMEATCVSEELCRCKMKKKLDKFRRYSRIKRVRDRLASLSLLTVRVVVLEYS